MADRVSSVHINIKFDIDEEDREFTQQAASVMERTDQAQSKVKEEEPTKTESEKSKDEVDEPPTIKKTKDEFIGPPTLEEYEKRLEKEWADRIKQQELKEKAQERLEKKGVGLASKGANIMGHPELLLRSGLRFIPHAVILTFVLKLSKQVFNYLTKPGGDLDLRIKFILQDEFNAFLTRQTQKDTQMGVRQVIIQSKVGFTAANGVNNYNTLKGIREGGINPERIDRITMVDHAKGLF